MDTSARMINTTPSIIVMVSGIATRVTSVSTSHSVDRGIAVCTLRVPALFSWVVNGANVSVQLGYAETATHPVFIGTVRKTQRVLHGDDGWEFDVMCDGQLARMIDGEETAVQFPKAYLGDVARSLAEMRGVGPLIVDRIKSPVDWEIDTNWIVLGGNKYVDDGMITIETRQGFYSWLNQKLKLFGYRIFDRPAWDVRVGRLFGRPDIAQHVATEGVDIFRGDRTIENDQINYWTVTGSRYTDDDGIAIEYRSIPASVPYDVRLRPKGYRPDRISDSILSSQFLVDTVRRVHEINHTEPTDWTSFEMPGNPLLQPGDAIAVQSEVLDHDSAIDTMWIMNVRHQFSDRGFWTSIDAWSGRGNYYPEGDDSVVIPVITDPVHVGDEIIPWYAMPSPLSRSVRFDVVIPNDYTAIVIEWWSHGCNSFFLDGASSESTVSTITVVQNDEEVGSTEMPMQPEEYERQHQYGASYAHWEFNRRPIPGKIDAGHATIIFNSGEDNRLPDSTKFDDFEVRDVVIRLTGVGTPDLPTPKG